ncbi:MAG: hypothetical protein KKH22_12185 [Proteobacteria bacterium]|nr:hypothetical protein [Pseudomonadota bacterium]
MREKKKNTQVRDMHYLRRGISIAENVLLQSGPEGITYDFIVCGKYNVQK